MDLLVRVWRERSGIRHAGRESRRRFRSQIVISPRSTRSADLLEKASGEFAVAVEKVQALRQAAEIARSKTQPAASGPSIGVETFESNRVQLGELFGERRVDAPGDESGHPARLEVYRSVFRNNLRLRLL